MFRFEYIKKICKFTRKMMAAEPLQVGQTQTVLYAKKSKIL